MSKIVLIETQYLPALPYMALIAKSDKILLEATESYQKQTYRNRCYILTSQGPKALTVPVNRATASHIREVKIDYSQRWEQIHLRTLRAAYGKAPFFEHYFEEVEKIIMSKCTFLFDLNVQLLTKCLYLLNISKPILFTEVYNKYGPEDVTDKRNSINEIDFGPIVKGEKRYFQLFGDKFVDNLSVVDLLMNEGTNARHLLYNY
mgnify:CR=1 FL=1